MEWEQRQYSCARRSKETFNLLLNNEKIGHYSRNQGFRSWGVAFPWGRGIHNKLGGRNSWGRGQEGAWLAVVFGLGGEAHRLHRREPLRPAGRRQVADLRVRRQARGSGETKGGASDHPPLAPPSRPACPAMWRPLILLLLLLLPAAPGPAATAAPIPETKTQESLQQSLLQGHNSLPLGVGERRTGKRGGGRQQGREPEGHQEGTDRQTDREGA